MTTSHSPGQSPGHSPGQSPGHSHGPGPGHGRHAVVLGCGMAGSLAAAALAADPGIASVTVVERDRLPAGPEHRKGLPQGHHAHVLMSGGARTVEALVPGTLERLAAAGAHRIGLPDGYVMLMPQGWLPRWTTDQYVISCTRALLDLVVRQAVFAMPGVRLREDTEVTGLAGDAAQVTGVRVRDRTTGAAAELPADFVVDATGRGSRARDWLAALGLPPVREDVVDSGLMYATRLFRAPGTAGEGFPVVNVQADPDSGGPGQTAALMPVEDGRWLVTLSGTRGGEPPSGEGEFVEFARGMRHPLVGDLIARAKPLGPVRVTRSTANRRRYYEELAAWPDGFVVLGDAVAGYNPVYGHGMSVAAHSAAALADRLREGGVRPGTARAVQRSVATAAAGAWAQATGQDVRFPGATGPRPGLTDRLMRRYMSRLLRTALGRPSIAEPVVEVFTLSAPMTRLVAPRVLLGTMLGPQLPPLSEPPLGREELARVVDGGTEDG